MNTFFAIAYPSSSFKLFLTAGRSIHYTSTDEARGQIIDISEFYKACEAPPPLLKTSILPVPNLKNRRGEPVVCVAEETAKDGKYDKASKTFCQVYDFQSKSWHPLTPQLPESQEQLLIPFKAQAAKMEDGRYWIVGKKVRECNWCNIQTCKTFQDKCVFLS